jgi:hypothetical protein
MKQRTYLIILLKQTTYLITLPGRSIVFLLKSAAGGAYLSFLSQSAFFFATTRHGSKAI